MIGKFLVSVAVVAPLKQWLQARHLPELGRLWGLAVPVPAGKYGTYRYIQEPSTRETKTHGRPGEM